MTACNAFVDESIHAEEQFICSALLFAQDDLGARISEALVDCGLKPGVDEYKSSALMVSDSSARGLRDRFKKILWEGRYRVALSFRHISERAELGSHILRLLHNVIEHQEIEAGGFSVFADQGISIPEVRRDWGPSRVSINQNCDSRLCLGIQLADMCAHIAATIVKYRAGKKKKYVRAGEASGYEPDSLLPLDFELWASMRYNLASSSIAPSSPTVEVPQAYLLPFGLDIGELCAPEIREAAEDLFGTVYLGCIH